MTHQESRTHEGETEQQRLQPRQNTLRKRPTEGMLRRLIREARAPFHLVHVNPGVDGCRYLKMSTTQHTQKRPRRAEVLSWDESDGSEPRLSKALLKTVLKSPHNRECWFGSNRWGGMSGSGQKRIGEKSRNFMTSELRIGESDKETEGESLEPDKIASGGVEISAAALSEIRGQAVGSK